MIPPFSIRSIALATLLALAPSAAHALVSTPSTTEGPYYTFNSGQTLSTAWITGEAADNDLTRLYSTSSHCNGTALLLSGTLVDINGTPIAGATIELWEADAGGIYYYAASGNNIASRDPNFQSYGRATTDATGAWFFRCIKPGLYTGRIRHLHYKVNVGGTTRLTSQFMFSDESASFSSDNVTAPLVTAGTIELATITTSSVTDSSGASVLVAAKQIVLAGTYANTGTADAPVITTAPLPAAIATGESVTFTVAATATGTLTYQWRKDGVALTGATAATYAVSSATTAAAGVYTVVVTNTANSATATSTSTAAALRVTAPTALANHALVNLSTRAYLPSASAVLIAGFTAQTSAGKPTLLRAVGPTLTTLGVVGAATDPNLAVYSATGAALASNDAWSASLSATSTALGAFALNANSADAALALSLPNGGGTAHVRATTAGLVLVEAYDIDGPTSASRLTNLSARSYVGTGTNALVAGFVIRGTGGKRVVIRGVGPRLAAFGLSGVLADPKIELYDAAGTKIAENDDWPSTLAPTFATLGAFPLTTGSKDASLFVTLPAGSSYTVTLSGVGATTGEALLELYEIP